MTLRLPDALQDPIVVRFYRYWDQKRGGRSAPARADLDPVEFPYALADLALAEVLATVPPRFKYRLVGENLVARDGYNMRGRFLDELPESEYRDRITQSWTAVVERRRPFHHIVSASFDGRVRTYESLVLPLMTTEDRVDMVIGIQRYLDRNVA